MTIKNDDLLIAITFVCIFLLGFFINWVIRLDRVAELARVVEIKSPPVERVIERPVDRVVERQVIHVVEIKRGDMAFLDWIKANLSGRDCPGCNINYQRDRFLSATAAKHK